MAKKTKIKINPKSKKYQPQWEIIEDDIPMAQDGGYQWSTQKQEPVKLAIPKDVNVSKTESNRKLTPKELEELRKYTEEQNQLRKEEEYNKRLQAIQQANQAKNQPLTIDNLRTQTQATGDKMSFAMNTRFGNPKEYPTLSGYMDALDFINPGKFIGDMATGLGALPYNIREGNYGQAALAVGLPLATGAIGSFGQKPAGSLFREQVYKAVDPVAYGMKEKLKLAPKTWLKNTISSDESKRALEIGKQLSNLNPEYFADDITKIGQNRLDAFRVGLKLPQKYDTFEQIAENTYRIKNMNPQVGEFSSVYNDLVANDYLKNATGVYHGENPLVTIAKKHDKLTSPTIKTEFGDYSVNDLRRYLMKEKDELPAWEQHRIVEKAKNPEFTHSVYDADRQGIMGSFRWDIKKPSFENDYKLHFQSNDLWNLNPFEKRGQITVKGNEELLENWYKPLENFEALSFVGGKPFNIQNNFVLDPKTYKILEKYKSGGKIKTDPQGYWNPKNKNEKALKIPSNNISMQNIDFPILGISDTNDIKMMYPNGEYQFQGNSVTEFPIMQQGGQVRQPIKGTKEQYQAYQDSLTLYNSYQELKKKLKEAKYVPVSGSNFGKLSEKDIIYSATVDPNTLTWLDKNTKLTGNTYYEDIEAKKEGNLYKTLDFYPGIINKDLGHQYFSTTIRPKSEENFRKFRFAGDQRLVYNYENVKPVQPIIYEPENERQNPLEQPQVLFPNTTNGQYYRTISKLRPKEQPIQIESKKADLLPSSSLNLEIDPIPFAKGTYFTRERKPQEEGSAQFGRKGKKDYFDKKTGKLLGTYKNGGKASDWEIID